LALRADARLVRDDKTGAEEALIEATKLEPRLLQAQLTLAQAFEQRGEHAKAMERYRAVLAQDPNNVVALNNLAYAVATREDKPGDALPLAQRAFTLSRGNATIADTLGWVHHLMGNNTEAARYLTQAARTELNNAEIQLHAAQVLLAGGQIDAARQALERALQADPAIADRDVVKALQAKVGKGGPAPRP
jgi:Tfp pilus assembly protein PilF